MNDFYANVAGDIGSVLAPGDIETHPSVVSISSKCENAQPFDFKPITPESLETFIEKSSVKKACGIDGISAKTIKACKANISGPLSKLINFSIATSKFPDRLKEAQVIPVYKKDPLDKQNYRPISILLFISKLYERSLNSQLSIHFDTILNPFIGAFRQGMGCQSTLLRLVEDWRNALDNRQYAAAIMMDPSKAFDCLPHGLLIGKLRAYGLSVKACALVSSYPSDRKHTVKLGSHHSEWSNITKGVPQGSILGPLLFNVFINDIFHALGRSSLYNYADDNTLSYAHRSKIAPLCYTGFKKTK